MTNLTGKVALVTGGSRGIGAAIAEQLAAAGADVALTFQNSQEGSQAVVDAIHGYGRRSIAIRVDSADAHELVRAVDQVAEELGGLDILVNNAGYFPSGPFDEVPLDEIDRALNIHARAAFVASQKAVGHMGAGGRIISIGSSLSEHAPFGGIALYNLSKSALNGFTKALARELGPRGIGVNLVQPGSTDTDMNPADGGAAESQRELSALGRFGAADDVAAMVTFLAGENGRSATGATFTVDSGMNA